VISGPIAIGIGAGITAAVINQGRQDPDQVMFAPVADPEVAKLNLKSGIFPAAVQFQAGGYIDSDNDGRGEFGLLAELGGESPVGKDKRVTLIDEELARGYKDGWQYQIHLPMGDHEALSYLSEDTGRQPSEMSDRQESQFVAYAWPADGETGTMLAITQDGTVYEAPWSGEYPEWFALYGEANWSSTPIWETYGTAKAKVEAEAKAEAEPLQQPEPAAPAAKPSGEPLY
jgi:hypothetical protein